MILFRSARNTKINHNVSDSLIRSILSRIIPAVMYCIFCLYGETMEQDASLKINIQFKPRPIDEQIKIKYDLYLFLSLPSKFFSTLKLYCPRLSVVLLSYDSRLILIRLDRRKKLVELHLDLFIDQLAHPKHIFLP